MHRIHKRDVRYVPLGLNLIREKSLATSEYAISTLPANVEAERSILGAILLDNFAYNQAAEHLRTEDFRSIRTGGFIRGWSISRNLRVRST